MPLELEPEPELEPDEAPGGDIPLPTGGVPLELEPELDDDEASIAGDVDAGLELLPQDVVAAT